MTIYAAMLCVVDEDEMSESFDTLTPYPLTPLHIVSGRFPPPLYCCTLIEYDAVATGELSSDGKEEEGTDTMVP